MGLSCYLAMTGAEFQNTDTPPRKVAWMACQFSHDSKGLSNLPTHLPGDSIVILNDLIPINGHDPHVVKAQLWKLAEDHSLKGILLDLERPCQKEMSVLVQLLIQDPPCPVCISDTYAKDLNCPVFLPAPGLCTPLSRYLEPWKGRQIWLELAVQAQEFRVNATGSKAKDIELAPLQEPTFYDANCFCRYHWHLQKDTAVFYLSRDYEELCQQEEAAKSLGVEQTIGLYQQLG